MARTYAIEKGLLTNRHDAPTTVETLPVIGAYRIGSDAHVLEVGLPMLGNTLLVSALPPGIGFLLGRKVLKMNPALLLGSLTGAMTSTSALAVVTDAANSSIPAIGYAGTDTFANVFLTFAGTFLMTL